MAFAFKWKRSPVSNRIETLLTFSSCNPATSGAIQLFSIVFTNLCHSSTAPYSIASRPWSSTNRCCPGVLSESSQSSALSGTSLESVCDRRARARLTGSPLQTWLHSVCLSSGNRPPPQNHTLLMDSAPRRSRSTFVFAVCSKI